MCFPIMTALGSLFLLFAFVLEAFIMVGNLSNTKFLNTMYFLKAKNQSANQSYQWGLWNYCTGDASGIVSSCGSRTPAYNWATTPFANQLVPGGTGITSSLAESLFLGMFILFFIGCIFSFLFWLASLPVCCMNRRCHGISMSTLVGTNFLIMLAALIMSLFIVITSVREITGSNTGWQAAAGNLVWVTIGAVVSLFLSLCCYTCGSICGPSSRRKNKNVTAVDPNYNNDKYGGANGKYMASPMFVPANQQAIEAPSQTPTMLQQPYQVSPSAGNQHLSPNMPSYTTTGSNYDPNSVSVPIHGYQTPTLQPANVPHEV